MMSMNNGKVFDFDIVKVKKELDVLTDGYDDDELLVDVLNHCYDVENVMCSIADYLEDIGGCHDWTKLEYFNKFREDCVERLSVKDFKKRDWYNIHTVYERHHIKDNCPVDVNLFDVLEMIVDCIVSGKSRSGVVNMDFLVLQDGILENAYWNTVKFLSDKIVVDDE